MPRLVPLPLLILSLGLSIEIVLPIHIRIALNPLITNLCVPHVGAFTLRIAKNWILIIIHKYIATLQKHSNIVANDIHCHSLSFSWIPIPWWNLLLPQHNYLVTSHSFFWIWITSSTFFWVLITSPSLILIHPPSLTFKNPARTGSTLSLTCFGFSRVHSTQSIARSMYCRDLDFVFVCMYVFFKRGGRSNFVLYYVRMFFTCSMLDFHNANDRQYFEQIRY
jgi:hypothetical protein